MKRKLKPKAIIKLAIILLVILVVILSPFMFVSIKLVGDKKVVLNYGEKYSESGYKAKLFNKDITKDIKVKSNVKSDIGNYEVSYSYKFLIYNVKRIRKVKVADLIGPEITLTGDKELSVTINTEYVEPGYEAIDNLDGDLTDKVKVTNNIDITQLGNYTVTYEVKDKAGNLSKVVRKVKVEKLKPTQMSVKDYTLDGWYDDVKLKPTKDYGDAYFNKLTLIGDSNIMNMYLEKYLTGIRAWAIPCLHAESMHSTDINLYGLGIKMKLLDAIEKYKPETIVLNFGSFSTAWISEETFIEKANLLIEKIKEKSPNTKIILASIYPIRQGSNINDFKQEAINKCNFLILEMAHKYNLKYLDVQEALKGSDGYGNPAYVSGDMFHLTAAGHQKVKEYIRTHALEEE